MTISSDLSVVGLRIGLDGTVEDVVLAADESGGYMDAVRRAIGCRWIERVQLTPYVTMWLDEDGMPDFEDAERFSAAVNRKATLIAARFGLTHQPYFGNAVFVGGDARICGLSVERLDALRTLAALLGVLVDLAEDAKTAGGAR